MKLLPQRTDIEPQKVLKLVNANYLKPAVSVVIPTKNEEQVICECLASVFNQSLKPLEVIIVDGKSTDNTIKEARQFSVKVFTETEPTSLPNARNLGIQNAKGNVIFIMDADVILEKNCISNAVKYFENPNIVAVIPSEENVAHAHLEKIQMDWIRGSANPFRSGIGISVFAEFLRKEVFERIKFDPRLGYAEDGDFQQRFKRFYGESAKIIHASDSKVSVHYSHTFKEFRVQYTWYGRTFKRYLLKNFSIKPLLNLGSLLAPTILLVLCFLTSFINQLFPLSVLVAVFLVARNLIVCYRTKSVHFVEFVAFEFMRSLFFVFGMVQGFFSRKRGK
jgi:glycosyltransferase involved in cell wall biosynthesis